VDKRIEIANQVMDLFRAPSLAIIGILR